MTHSPRALLLLPDGPNYRRTSFDAGLRAAGYAVEDFANPRAEDIIVMWNRHPRHEGLARRFEGAGGKVVVCENGYLGKIWQGAKWFAIALGHHAGAGNWRIGDGRRWARIGVPLASPRVGEGETVVLGQRGIGEPGIASPPRWAEDAQGRYGGRIRPHPGIGACVPILEDLARARRVITWASGAAFFAHLAGIEVISEFPRWIGKARLDERQGMFERMAWAMWSLPEVESGEAFRWLVPCES